MSRRAALLSLLLLVPAAAAAQTTPQPGAVGCMHPDHGGTKMISCRGQGFAACAEALSDHECREHGLCGGTQSNGIRRPGSAAEGIVRVTAGGAFLGGVFGSLAPGENDIEQAVNAGLGVGGLGLTLGTVANARSIPVVVGVVLAGAGGAQAGTSWAKYQEEQGKESNRTRDTIAGAAAGAVTFVLAKSVGGSKWKSKEPPPPGRLNRGLRIQPVFTMRFMGIIATW